MKSFFGRREEEIEEKLIENDELEIIDLDNTADWSKLDIAEELAKHQAVNLMEELSDGLAIIDAVEEDILIEDIRANVYSEQSTYHAEPQNEDEYMSDEDEEADLEYMSDEDEEADLEYMADGDEDIEYISDDEEEEDDEEYEDGIGISFFENIGAWLANWTVMDKVVAVTGALVLVLAIATAGVYAGNRGLNKQIEAFAPVGEQLETVGVIGQDKLLAVADAKKAMLEAAKLEAELNQEYEENDLSTEVKVIMKMTSVQKDLKIKFVNKKTGKLVGNIPFEVKIVDADNKTYNKIDEDRDGIIYLTDIAPGNYSVSMVELEDLEGYSFNTSTEKIKVKDKIAYEKVDVSDEIKDQSEVDVSKEDTAQKTETEAVLTDTVEWVASTKKESASQDTYVAVDKNTIADPALSASLNFDFGILRVMQQSMLATEGFTTIDESGDENSGSENSGIENNGGTSGTVVAVTGVTLDKTALTMNIGEGVTLAATVTPGEATNKGITWSSSDGNVATVDNGTVTAKAAGTATITVTTADGGKTATCVVTVNAATPPETVTPAVTAITMDKTSVELEVGGKATVKAEVTATGDADKTVTWSSSNEAVATVSNGEITAVAEGNATITAKAGDKTATCTVKVTKKAENVAVTEISINKTTLELEVEKTETLTVTVKPDNATNKTVTWSSDKTDIATVDSTGKVTAVKEGTATVTAKVGDLTKTCTVTVKAKGPVNVESIAVNPATVTLEIGKTTVLGVTFKPENVTDKTVTWKSSDESKATVDAKGCVTAKAEGTVTITATTKAGNKTATCTVTIPKSYDPKTDTTKVLKDKSGNQMYVLVNGQYVEAKVADYYKAGVVFYKKEKTAQYVYTGWQNLDGKTYFFDKNGNKVTGEQVIQGARYTFNSDGTLNTGSGILGIDVSTWNGNIDWNKVKNSGVSYVIIRTGFRGSTQGALVEDNKFRQNIQGATNAGLKVGVYFFSQAVNEVEAVEEASMVLSQVKGYKLAYPVFIDVEPSGGRADKLSSGDRTKVINAFCQTIQNGGYKAGIYANKTWLSQKMNISALSGYKIWLAQYNSKVTYSGRYDMWQYSDKGKINGISGNVDMNLSYLSY